MATAFGILNDLSAAGQTLKGPTPLSSTTNGASGSSSSNGSGGDSATISANDFLTLLVTEMKNQDPTANTDPNEYINQLVQVNSLEQLISINQSLTNNSGGSSTTSAASATGKLVSGINSAGAGSASHASVARAAMNGQSQLSTAGLAPTGTAGPWAFGNLSVPMAVPAAQRVAQS